MKHKTAALAAALVAQTVLGANVPHFNHVPEKLPDDIRQINPKAAERNHMLIVNVGGALSEADFSTVVTYALTRVNVNAWTNSIPTSMWRACIDRPELVKETFGPHATVVVFLEKNQQGFSFMNVPGHWSMINLRGLDKDSPTAQALRDRTAKMILKGMAHACGVGASVDELCALNYNSFTLKGMDKTDIRISPMSYFPMLSTLEALGGPEAVNVNYE